MNYIKLSIILSLALLNGACSTQQISANSTAFYIDNFTPSGSIFVLPANPKNNNSLEFAHYKKKFEEKLSSAGYTIVNNKNDATYIAVIDYGISDGETAVISQPVYATGSYRFGPSFGLSGTRIIGTTNDTITTYTRSLALDIIEADALQPDIIMTGNKRYESRVKSVGSCSDMAGVFEPLLTTMFNNFPGENGKAITRTIRYQGQCND